MGGYGVFREKALWFRTFSGIWRFRYKHVVLPGKLEDLTVSNGVDVGKLSKLLEIRAHQDFHLTHVRLLDLQDPKV